MFSTDNGATYQYAEDLTPEQQATIMQHLTMWSKDHAVVSAHLHKAYGEIETIYKPTVIDVLQAFDSNYPDDVVIG